MPEPSRVPQAVLDLVAERQAARELRDFVRWKSRTELLTQGFTGHHRHPPDGGPGSARPETHRDRRGTIA